MDGSTFFSWFFALYFIARISASASEAIVSSHLKAIGAVQVAIGWVTLLRLSAIHGSIGQGSGSGQFEAIFVDAPTSRAYWVTLGWFEGACLGIATWNVSLGRRDTVLSGPVLGHQLLMEASGQQQGFHALSAATVGAALHVLDALGVSGALELAAVVLGRNQVGTLAGFASNGGFAVDALLAFQGDGVIVVRLQNDSGTADAAVL